MKQITDRKHVLTKLIKDNKFTSYCEVGVWKGFTIKHIINSCPGIRAVGVDPLSTVYDYCDEFPCLMGEPKKSQEELDEIAKDLERFEGLEFVRARSEKVVDNFPDGSFDLVFLDAVHIYDCIAADIDAWLPKVRKGGILSGHDYTPLDTYKNGVKQAVDERFGERVNTDVDAVWWVRI